MSNQNEKHVQKKKKLVKRSRIYILYIQQMCSILGSYLNRI